MRIGYKSGLKIMVMVVSAIVCNLHAMEDEGSRSKGAYVVDLFFNGESRYNEGRACYDAKMGMFYVEKKENEESNILMSTARAIFRRVKKLLSKGQEEKNAALFEAAQKGDGVGLVHALQEGADIEAKIAWSGQTPLLAAGTYDRIECIYLLLDNKAQVNVADKVGKTPLMAAASIGNVDLVRRLLESNAAIDDHVVSTIFSACKGDTALALAAKAGSGDVVRLLLEHKATINTRNSSHKTPLMQATQGRHKKVVKMLLQEGAFFSAADMSLMVRWKPIGIHDTGTFSMSRSVKEVIKQAQVEHALEEQDWVPEELMAFNGVMFNVNSATAINILVNIVGAYAMPCIDNRVLQELEVINDDPTMHELLIQELIARSRKHQEQQTLESIQEIKED